MGRVIQFQFNFLGSGIVGMLAKAAAKQSTSKATSQKQKESLNSNEVDLKYESENNFIMQDENVMNWLDIISKDFK